MRNFIKRGIGLDLVAPSGGVTAGTGVKIGAILAIPSTDAAEGETFNGDTEGCFEHAAATGQAWTQGALLYWDNTAKVFTTTATSNTKAGVAIDPKDSAAAVGNVKLIAVI
jgi:predicted RecA/RadA family phage recombinase